MRVWNWFSLAAIVSLIGTNDGEAGSTQLVRGANSTMAGHLATGAAHGDGVEERSFTAEGITGKFTLWRQTLGKGKPGLLLFIHGAGAGEDYASLAGGLIELARDRHLLLVAVQAPAHAFTWPNSDAFRDNRHAAYLKALVEQRLAKDFPFDPGRSYFVGLSAGSTFLSGDFLPEIDLAYSGGFVLLCGGAMPFGTSGRLQETVARRERFQFYYRIDRGDFLYPQTAVAIDFYKKSGFKTFADISADGHGHCAFDFVGAVKTGLDKIVSPRK